MSAATATASPWPTGRRSRSGEAAAGGLDAIDATPVLDIKPYMIEFAPREAVRQPRWPHELMSG